MAYVQDGRDTASWPQFVVTLQAWKDYGLLLCLTAGWQQSQGGTRLSTRFPTLPLASRRPQGKLERVPVIPV